MNAGQSEKDSPETPTPAETAITKTFRDDLPQGVIVFTAPPKLSPRCEKTSRHGKPKRIQKEIENIGELLAKLEVRAGKNKGASGATARKDVPLRTFGKKSNLLPSQGLVISKPYLFRHCGGLWRTKFKPVIGTGTEKEKIKHNCVSAMSEYSNKSLEEIRVEDYLSGRKGPAKVSHYGPKFLSVKGTDSIMRSGVQTCIDTRHLCITAMPEYQQTSFEELRLEHYMPSIGWKERIKYTLPAKELQQLPIALDTQVFVFLQSSKRKGKVRFVGYLPGKRGEIHVGVEYDGPFGVGNGCSGGVRLFRTRDNHAEFVPLDSVLPDYLVDEEKQTTTKNDRDKGSSAMGATGSSESSGESGPNKCAVCWSSPVEMFFQPCGHVCCCSSCAKMVKDCPVCRKRIREKHRAYLT